MAKTTKCFQCQYRAPGCHSVCIHYVELQQELEVSREAKKKEWEKNDEFFNFRKDSALHFAKKRGRKL